MKKNSFFFILFALLTSLASSWLYAENKTGYEQCKELFTFLQKNNFYPVEMPLLQNQSSDFPFNIRLDFNANHVLHNKENPETEIQKLLLVFKVEDAQSHYVFTKKMIESIMNSNRTGNISLIFTYGDAYGFQNRHIITGTKSFIENTYDTNSISAICFNLEGKSNFVIPGSGGDCSPAWLIRIVAESLFDNHILYTLKGGILSSLYRLNFLQVDFRTGEFLKNGIPACGVELELNDRNSDYEDKLAAFFGDLSNYFDPSETTEWDRHSRIIQFFTRTIILSERFTIISFILVAFLSLFTVCEFSFLIKLTKRDISSQVIKSWYLIPLSAAITMIAFLASQGIVFCFQKFLNVNFVTLFTFKLLVAFILISIVYLTFIRFQGIYSSNVYSYLLSVTSLFNIFLFSAIDLSLFFAAVFEYLIINFTRPFRRTVSLAVSFLLLTVPFIPYAYQFIKYIDARAIRVILYSSPLVNLAIAFAVLPFEFIWLRILARLNMKWRTAKKEQKKFIRQNMFAIGGAVGISVIAIVLITVFIPEEYKIKNVRKTNPVENASDSLISIITSDEDFFGDTIRTVSVKTEKSCRNMVICIDGKNEAPVLYSDDSFDSDIPNHDDYFLIPLWAPKEITFSYIANNYDDSEISVTQYFEEKTLYRTLMISAKNREGADEI